MAKNQTKTQTKENPAPAPKEAESNGSLAVQQPADEGPRGLRLRLPFPKNWAPHYGVTASMWQVYIDAIWPNAQTWEAVCMAIVYCKSRNLDPMKRMVHIVPMWSKTGGPDGSGGMIETVWPSIAEIRITATRTGVYAGKDAIEVGPLTTRTFRNEHNNKVSEKTVTYHEWMRLTVYKIVQGVRCAFVGPKVLWEESYATENRFSEVPNEMWADRTQGQHEKCAEAASLRSAFPEELGGEYAAEEMHSRVITDHAKVQKALPPPIEGEVRPQPNMNSEFKPAEQAKPAEVKVEPKMEDVKPSDRGGDQHQRPPAEDSQQAKTGDDEGQETGEDASAEAAAAAKTALDAILQTGIEGLPNVHRQGALADLREQVEQELPPDSQHLKDWIKACEKRQNELLAAQREKAKK